jgi:hypothetical protein
MMVYFIILFVVCIISWFILKPLVGYLALRRDPISAGRLYLKRSLRKHSSINAGLISDEAYTQLARKAFQFAEFSHTVQHQTLFGCYMSCLDLYIQEIQLVMTGQATDLDGPVGQTLIKYGVPIQKTAV